MDDRQTEFRREVENFDSGFFRASFSTPEQLKDEIVRALRQLAEAEHAWPEGRFIERLQVAMDDGGRGYGSREPQLTIAFLPQPEIRVHLPDAEGRVDALFMQLCKTGLASLRDGYKMEENAESVGIRSAATKLKIFQDGLRVISLGPQPAARDNSSFDYVFVPPSYVKALGNGAFDLFEANSG